MAHRKQITVIMGPTGTGKSALALAVAQTRPAVIINADAMQMVADLRIITARPSIEEEAQAEHALYGVLPAREPTSVARWIAMVTPIITRAWAEEKTPLLVGGTGMYIKALREGLAVMPPVPDAIRQHVRTLTAPELYAALQKQGAEADFKPGDTQRLARALEILLATGQSIQHWQAQKHQPTFPDASWHSVYLQMPRAELYARLDRRFMGMMQMGALDEVRALQAQDLPADTPITRAHGVPELTAYLRGDMTLDAAIAKAQQNTRNYAKRQMTWLRHSAGDATALDATARELHTIFI